MMNDFRSFANNILTVSQSVSQSVSHSKKPHCKRFHGSVNVNHLCDLSSYICTIFLFVSEIDQEFAVSRIYDIVFAPQSKSIYIDCQFESTTCSIKNARIIGDTYPSQIISICDTPDGKKTIHWCPETIPLENLANTGSLYRYGDLFHLFLMNHPKMLATFLTKTYRHYHY